MNIAVIILNYNSSSDCRKCIGFLKQQEDVETEIMVVDNCSPLKGEQETIANLCQEQGCTFIQANENRGYNAGNNIGLRYAAEKGYKFALIANPDMEFPQKDYLKRMVEAIEQDDNIAVCGSDIITPEGKHQNPMKRDGKWCSSFKWIKGLVCHNKNGDSYDFIDNYQESHYCHKVSGCCLIIRMNFAKTISFFDEHVFLYCEEAILSRQVEQNERRMYYLAETQAIHNHIKSEKGNPRDRFKAWISSRIYFEEKYNREGWLKNTIKTISWRIYGWLFILRAAIKR